MSQQKIPWFPLLLLGIGLTLLLLSGRGALGPLQDVLTYLAAPLENAFSGVVETVGDLTHTSGDVRALQKQVEELQRLNDILIQENIRRREYEAENEQLRALLNFARENPTYSLMGADVIERGCDLYPCARVVGRDTNPYLRYLVINAGSRDGIAIGMPVVTGGAAMVGRIAQVSPNLAYVQLINDPQSHVAAVLQESRVTGIVQGTLDGGLIMTDILPDETVNEGETVITSAAGGLLPRGLILGQIVSVSYLESELFQRAVVRPAIDFRRLEMVLVITDFPRHYLEELQQEETP